MKKYIVSTALSLSAAALLIAWMASIQTAFGQTKPTLTIEAPNGYTVGSSWTLSISNAYSNKAVSICMAQGSNPISCAPAKNLNLPEKTSILGGDWTGSGTFAAGTEGPWMEYAKIGTEGVDAVVETTDPITFTVGKSVPTPAFSVTAVPQAGTTQWREGDAWTIRVTNAQPSSPVTFCVVKNNGTPDCNLTTNYTGFPANTDAYGRWTAKGTFDSSAAGTWKEYVIIGGVRSNVASFTVYDTPSAPDPTPTPVADKKPTLTISTKVSPVVNDAWTLNVAGGAPGKEVYLCTQKTGTVETCFTAAQYGFLKETTDSLGTWSATGIFGNDSVGTWREYVKVGTASSDPISFTVSAAPAPVVQTPYSPLLSLNVPSSPKVGDTWTLSVSQAAPSELVYLCAQKGSNGETCFSAIDYQFTSTQTDTSGRWSVSGKFGADAIGDWRERVRVGSVSSNYVSFSVSEVPVAQAPRLTFSAAGGTIVGKPWTLTLSGAPNDTPVNICMTYKGTDKGCAPAGGTNGLGLTANTDLSGGWAGSGTFQPSTEGDWVEYVKVGSLVSNEVRFTVSVAPADTTVPQTRAMTFSISPESGGNVGNPYTLSLSGAKANSEVSICMTKDGIYKGCATAKNLGFTDAATDYSGSWKGNGTFAAGTEGDWVEKAMVYGAESNPITFKVMAGGSCTAPYTIADTSGKCFFQKEQNDAANCPASCSGNIFDACKISSMAAQCKGCSFCRTDVCNFNCAVPWISAPLTAYDSPLTTTSDINNLIGKCAVSKIDPYGYGWVDIDCGDGAKYNAKTRVVNFSCKDAGICTQNLSQTVVTSSCYPTKTSYNFTAKLYYTANTYAGGVSVGLSKEAYCSYLKANKDKVLADCKAKGAVPYVSPLTETFCRVENGYGAVCEITSSGGGTYGLGCNATTPAPAPTPAPTSVKALDAYVQKTWTSDPAALGWVKSLSSDVALKYISVKFDPKILISGSVGSYVMKTWCNNTSSDANAPGAIITPPSPYTGKPAAMPLYSCSYTTPGTYSLRVLIAFPDINGTKAEAKIPITINQMLAAPSEALSLTSPSLDAAAKTSSLSNAPASTPLGSGTSTLSAEEKTAILKLIELLLQQVAALQKQLETLKAQGQ